jgi:hypothetical protein
MKQMFPGGLFEQSRPATIRCSQACHGDNLRSLSRAVTNFNSGREFLKNQNRTSFDRFTFLRLADQTEAFQVKINSQPKIMDGD